MRVTLYSCGQAPEVVTSLNVNVGVASQASVAVGFEKISVAGHWMVEGPPTPEITGAVLSVTEIVWEAWELLPQSSMAVHVRVTLYS